MPITLPQSVKKLLQDTAYGLIALLAALWLTAFGWGLRRIRLGGVRALPWAVPEPAKAA